MLAGVRRRPRRDTHTATARSTAEPLAAAPRCAGGVGGEARPSRHPSTRDIECTLPRTTEDPSARRPQRTHSVDCHRSYMAIRRRLFIYCRGAFGGPSPASLTACMAPPPRVSTRSPPIHTQPPGSLPTASTPVHCCETCKTRTVARAVARLRRAAHALLRSDLRAGLGADGWGGLTGRERHAGGKASWGWAAEGAATIYKGTCLIYHV